MVGVVVIAETEEDVLGSEQYPWYPLRTRADRPSQDENLNLSHVLSVAVIRSQESPEVVRLFVRTAAW